MAPGCRISVTPWIGVRFRLARSFRREVVSAHGRFGARSFRRTVVFVVPLAYASG